MISIAFIHVFSYDGLTIGTLRDLLSTMTVMILVPADEASSDHGGVCLSCSNIQSRQTPSSRYHSATRLGSRTVFT